MCCSATKLRNISPDPINSTNDSATSTTTAALRSTRPPPRLAVRPLPRNTCITSGREARSAGTTPKIAAATNPAATENARTAGSISIASSRGRFVGPITISWWMPSRASSNPTSCSAPGDDQAFGQHLPHQTPAARAERGAHGKLSLPQRRPDHQQIRDIRAGDQQQKNHRPHQRDNRRPHLRDQILLHRLKTHMIIRRLLQHVISAIVGGDTFHLRLCLIDRNARL